MRPFLLLIAATLAFATGAMFAGCTFLTRSETTRSEEITVQAQVPVATLEGIKTAPLIATIHRVGSESAEKIRELPDLAALAAAAGQGATSLGAVGAGTPWGTIIGGAGAALTAATTGYLALKKREQMRRPEEPRAGHATASAPPAGPKPV